MCRKSSQGQSSETSVGKCINLEPQSKDNSHPKTEWYPVWEISLLKTSNPSYNKPTSLHPMPLSSVMCQLVKNHQSGMEPLFSEMNASQSETIASSKIEFTFQKMSPLAITYLLDQILSCKDQLLTTEPLSLWDLLSDTPPYKREDL
jgi:hypothetical protein